MPASAGRDGGQLEPVSAGFASIPGRDLSSIAAVSPGLTASILDDLGGLAASVGTVAGRDLSIGAGRDGLDVHANRKLRSGG